MAQNSGYVNLYLTTPDGLIFEGETNDDGKIILPFDRKELLLGPDYEIGLESYTIDTTTMYNVLDDQYEVYFIASDNTQTRKKWPPCKLATVLEVLKKIDEMNLGIVMDFSHPYSHSMDLKKGKLLLPIAVARVLGIATNQYKPNPLVEVLNPSFSLAEEKIVDVEYIGITGSTPAKFHFPTIYSKNIWNYVSTNSFQSLYFYSDLVVDEMISGVRIPLLGVFPFKELGESNTWRDNEPVWRRVNRERISSCYIQLADSRGRLFKNVCMSILCRIRRRNLK